MSLTSLRRFRLAPAGLAGIGLGMVLLAACPTSTGVTLHGTVEVTNSTGIALPVVRLTYEGGSKSVSGVAIGGTVTFTNVSEGACTVTGSDASGNPIASASGTVRGGETLRLTLE